MHIKAFALVCTMLSASIGEAQQSAPPPATVTPRLDTPQARASVVTLQPGTSFTAGNTTNAVVIYLDSGSMTLKQAGQTATIDVQRGEVRWRPAGGAGVSENTSGNPMRVLEVEMKGPPSGPAPKSDLDAVLVDPRHFKVVLDNDFVRVLRVHYEPHDKSENHAHILNRVILYLTEQPGVMRDEVRAAAPRTHVEENPSDQPLDAIAIELK